MAHGSLCRYSCLLGYCGQIRLFPSNKPAGQGVEIRKTGFFQFPNGATGSHSAIAVDDYWFLLELFNFMHPLRQFIDWHVPGVKQMPTFEFTLIAYIQKDAVASIHLLCGIVGRERSICRAKSHVLGVNQHTQRNQERDGQYGVVTNKLNDLGHIGWGCLNLG